MSAARSSAGSRTQLWLLAAVFVVPLLAAFLLYYAGPWRPAGRTNIGELIEPPRPLPEVALETPDGQRTGSGFLRRKWSLVYVGDGACNEACRKALVTTRQVRLALGGDAADRVQRVFLYTGACCDSSYFEREHPGLVAASLAGPAAEPLRTAFAPAAPGEPAVERIYIVDPLGNLMMSHTLDGEGKGLLEDMERLLKLSHIG